MITLDWVYVFAGLTFAGFSVLTAADGDHPRRFGTAAFWGLLAVSFLFGPWLGDLGNGVLVLALAALAGWAGLLPQALAALGAVFVIAGVGDRIGELFADYLPLDTRLLAVVAYCLGMALFTFIMGNAFAAFPVMTAAVGLPLVVLQFGGDPAVVCAIGMLSGFCGTLTKPMAANFNVVPAALLDLPDRDAPFNGVIRVQLPTAAVLLAINVALMYLLAFRAPA